METNVSQLDQVQSSNSNEARQLESPFIEANTQQVDVHELAEEHIILVFVKDNEPLVSHAEFIDHATGIVHSLILN